MIAPKDVHVDNLTVWHAVRNVGGIVAFFWFLASMETWMRWTHEALKWLEGL